MLDKRAFHYFVEDIELKLARPQMAIELDKTSGGYAVTVTAGSFLKDLCLLADRIDAGAVVDTMLVTLLPGEAHVFEISTVAAISAAEIVIGTVLRSANDLVHAN
jgi:beta-mannosidase